MGQTLTNGIYLPNEGERNCYSGLAANWNAVDTLKGNYSLHAINVDIHVTATEKETWNGKADASALTAHTGDATIHVTAEDKETWNGKADASALTAHTGDTTIHVTAEDKQAWNGHVADTTIHVTSADKQAWNSHVADSVKHVTAEDKAKWDAVTSKADDSDVVHKSGNETIGGTKTFTDNNMIKTSSPKVLLINTEQTGNTPPSSNTVSLLRFDGGTVNNFGGVQCEFLTTGENRLSNYVKDITTAKLNTIQQRANSTTATTTFNADLIIPATDGITALGISSKRWKDVRTIQINGLEPSSLSLPNNKGYVDISGYFTNTGDGQTNSYTASVNGWIYLNVVATRLVMQIRDSNDNNIYADMRVRSSDGTIYMTIPISSGNKLLTQWFTSSSVTVTTARFIPCQGNA